MVTAIGAQAAGVQLSYAYMSSGERARMHAEQACVDALDADAERTADLRRFERPSWLDTLLATPSGPERLAQDGPAGR